MTNEKPQYMSLSEAAEKLGYASTSTLRALAAADGIPGKIKVGKTWAVPVEWVLEQVSAKPKTRQGWRRGKKGKHGE